MTACPTQAIGLAGSALPQIEAQLEAALTALPGEHADARRGILLACRGADPASEDQSLAAYAAVEVPCVRMATPGWALQALAAGASSVVVDPCGETCRAIWHQRAAAVVRILASLAIGDADERVRVVPTGHPASNPGTFHLPPALVEPGGMPITLAEPEATARAIAHLAPRGRRPSPTRVELQESVIGVAHVVEDACTLCGACAQACPTGSLSQVEDERIRLLFDPCRCAACAACVAACPERAISVEAVVDPTVVLGGIAALAAAERQACERCGGALPPPGMRARIWETLGGSDESRPLDMSICVACGLSASSGARAPSAGAASAGAGPRG